MKTKTIIALVLVCLPVMTSGYNYNGKEINIKIPENITEFEYRINTNQCSLKEYGCKIAYLNMLLVKKGYAPLY